MQTLPALIKESKYPPLSCGRGRETKAPSSGRRKTNRIGQVERRTFLSPVVKACQPPHHLCLRGLESTPRLLIDLGGSIAQRKAVLGDESKAIEYVPVSTRETKEKHTGYMAAEGKFVGGRR